MGCIYVNKQYIYTYIYIYIHLSNAVLYISLDLNKSQFSIFKSNFHVFCWLYVYIHTHIRTHTCIYICTYTLYIDININKQIQSNPICPIFLTRSTTCLVRVATGLCPILCQPHPRWNGFIKVRVPKSDGEPWAGCWASWANKTLDELDWNS